MTDREEGSAAFTQLRRASPVWIGLLVLGILADPPGAAGQVRPEEVADPPESGYLDLDLPMDPDHGIPLQLLGVVFEADLSAADRSAALNEFGLADLLSAELNALFDGYYVVRYHEVGDLDDLVDLARRMNQHPSIRAAVLTPQIRSSADASASWFPESPPDSFPAEDSIRYNEEWQLPSDLLSIAFEPGLSALQKSRLLDAVGGLEVVGGAPVDILDGIYIVRLSTTGFVWDLVLAIELLRTLPGVVSAALIVPVSVGDR